MSLELGDTLLNTQANKESILYFVRDLRWAHSDGYGLGSVPIKTRLRLE